MAKKDSKAAKAAKIARMAEKNAKAKAKSENKSKKQAAKLNDEDESMDIEEILAEFARQQAEFEKISIKVIDKPAPRQGAVLVPSSEPGLGRRAGELFLFGGESLNNGLSSFFNDLSVYSTDTGIWRQVTSPNSPLPRSGHSLCPHPSGVLVMFGGEFSSPKQSTFYHYGDTWVLEASTKEWTKIEAKKAPLARSGHRMVAWKNYVLLHGGFRDLAQSTSYLDDLWAFDVKDYKWHEISFLPTMSKPDPRSGHSFLPTADGAVLWGGYSKVKAARGLQKGKVHQDAWTLQMKSDLKSVRWERRKKGACQPSPRIGCYMVPHRNRGLLFGGVYDTTETEESLDSVFYNTLHSYQIDTNRWTNLVLRPQRKRAAPAISKRSKDSSRDDDLHANLAQILKNMDLGEDAAKDLELVMANEEDDEGEEVQEPQYTISDRYPHPRFNASVAVCGDSLYIYGGTFEHEDQEFALDGFYAIDLTKLDGVRVFWESQQSADDEESDAENDGEEEDDDDVEESEDQVLEALEASDGESDEGTESEPELPDPRPWLPHPKPFQSVTDFYRASVDVFVEWALKQDRDARGKDLKRNAFELCEDRWWERREAVCAAEDELEEAGGVAEVIERAAPRVGGASGRR